MFSSKLTSSHIFRLRGVGYLGISKSTCDHRKNLHENRKDASGH